MQEKDPPTQDEEKYSAFRAEIDLAMQFSRNFDYRFEAEAYLSGVRFTSQFLGKDSPVLDIQKREDRGFWGKRTLFRVTHPEDIV